MNTRGGESGSTGPMTGQYTRFRRDPEPRADFPRGPEPGVEPRAEYRRGAEPPEDVPRTDSTGEFRLSPSGRSRPSRTTMGVALAVVLSAVALVLAVVSLVTQPSPAPAVSAPSPQSITDADKAMCQAIGPLMKENDDRSNAFLATGDAGSPERDAALTKFVTDTRAWAQRTQQAVDAHATPPRFTTRALQRYVDDMQLFTASVRPGPGTQYDEAAWTDSIVAYGGVLSSCQQLGVNW